MQLFRPTQGRAALRRLKAGAGSARSGRAARAGVALQAAARSPKRLASARPVTLAALAVCAGFILWGLAGRGRIRAIRPRL